MLKTPSGEVTCIESLDPFITINSKSLVMSFLRGKDMLVLSATDIIALFFCSPSTEESENKALDSFVFNNFTSLKSTLTKLD